MRGRGESLDQGERGLGPGEGQVRLYGRAEEGRPPGILEVRDGV